MLKAARRSHRSARLRAAVLAAALLAAGIAVAAPPDHSRYFVIEVVDEQTGRGVPLVELRRTNEAGSFTDSNGIAALEEPGLEGQEVFFHVRSHGYECAADGFGIRGVRLQFRAGEKARVNLRRLNVAERLYRVTGEGIYRDSVLAGLPVPIRQPLLNSQVVGQDSVLNAVYRGRLYWFWGDTSRPSYPLGNFHTTGATSLLPADGGLDPSRGVDLTYFQEKSGFTREMAPFSDRGPTWLSALVSLGEGDGEQLFATYTNVNQKMEALERGLARFNDATQRFDRVARFDLRAPARPGGHPFKGVENGKAYVYFADPFPLVRVLANPADLSDPAHYEAFTCLKPGTRFDAAHPLDTRLERDAAGKPRYGWKRNTSPVQPEEQAKLIKLGLLKPAEALLQLQDPATGKLVQAHAGSVAWNAYRKRWLLIATEVGGTSTLGETWYAEAETPVGPWVYARKIVTHQKYSFYNPRQHPYFAQEGGRLVYFEGTYTYTFSGIPENATPRYDYNQIMYRVDLADPRLSLPQAVQLASRFTGAPRLPENRVERAEFCAPDRAGAGLIPVFWRKHGGVESLVLGASPSVGERAAFYALPATAPQPASTTVQLIECTRGPDGARAYVVEGAPCPPGFRLATTPLCRVWRNPCPVGFSTAEVAARR